jgi:hypothetical protein
VLESLVKKNAGASLMGLAPKKNAGARSLAGVVIQGL